MTTTPHPSHVTVSDDRYMVTGRRDQPAAAYLDTLADAQREALANVRQLTADRDRARQDERNAAAGIETETETANAAGANIRALIRALANRDETEPTAVPGEHETDRTEYRAAFGSTGAYTRQSTPGWSSKPKPKSAGAYARHWPYDNRSQDLYQSARGTSDPAKLAAELDKAQTIAQDAARALTGSAYLIARDITPSDPAQLITAEVSTHADYRYPGAYSARVQLMAGPVMLADLSTFDLRYDRTARPILDEAQRATLAALTGADVPVSDLTPDDPAERNRRMDAISAYLEPLGPQIIAHYLDSLRTSAER